MSDKELNSILAKADMEYEIIKDKARGYGELKARIDKAIEYMYEVLECNYHGGNVTFDALIHNTENILKGVDEK